MLFLEWLVRLWSLKRPVGSKRVEMVVAISYCTGKNRLMLGTARNLQNAVSYCRINPWSYLCMSEGCSYPFEGAAKLEGSLKSNEVKRSDLTRVVVGKPMINTVDEAYMIKEALPADLFDRVSSILICTGPAHSRSSYLIYRRLFPKAKVYLKLSSFRTETQPDHSVRSQRSPWVWFISNVARHMALRVLPLSVVRKIQRRPTEVG